MNDFVLLKVIWSLKAFTTDLQQKKTEKTNWKKIREKVPIPPRDQYLKSRLKSRQ